MYWLESLLLQVLYMHDSGAFLVELPTWKNVYFLTLSVVSFLMCRIGIIKIQRKLLQRCVVSWLSFLEHFFFTRQKTWLTVCHDSCNLYTSLENILFCLLRFSFRTGPGQSLSTQRLKHASQNGFAIEVMPLKCQDSMDDETFMTFPKVDSGYLKEEHTLRYKDSSIV